MERVEYDHIYAQEESHFYYRSLHTLVISLLQQQTPRTDLDILDAGCGTGGLASRLMAFGDVSGVDIHPRACELAKHRGVRVTQASITELPFKDRSFDVVTSIDVLYHQKVDDRKALEEFARVLRPGGFAIVKVPATAWLRSAHDRHVHTRQRYSKDELQEKILGASFTLVRLAATNPSLWMAAVGRHWFEKLFGSTDHSAVKPLPKALNETLYRWLCWENALTVRSGFPVGLGLIAVAKKELNA